MAVDEAESTLDSGPHRTTKGDAESNGLEGSSPPVNGNGTASSTSLRNGPTIKGSSSSSMNGSSPSPGINPLFQLSQHLGRSQAETVRIVRVGSDRVVIDGNGAPLPDVVSEHVEHDESHLARLKARLHRRSHEEGLRPTRSDESLRSEKSRGKQRAVEDDAEPIVTTTNGGGALMNGDAHHPALTKVDSTASLSRGYVVGSAAPASRLVPLDPAAGPSSERAIPMDGYLPIHKPVNGVKTQPALAANGLQKLLPVPPVTVNSRTAERRRAASPISNASTNSVASDAMPSIRRTATTGSAAARHHSSVTSSPSKRQRVSPNRALSFDSDAASSSPFIHSSDEGATIGPSPVMPLSNEEQFESSVAEQAEALRRERQTKRLEKEKEAAAASQVKRARSQSREGPADGTAPGWTGAKDASGAPAERVLVGNLIGEDHVNYVLMYNMLTGIRIGVSRCEAKPSRALVDADYTARHKFSFDIVGNELTPSAKYDFKFKDYSPWIFRDIRAFFRLDPADYLLSLTAKYILSELGSPGKSGSFFYFSRDYRFIIKTIRHAEHKFLLRILKPYHEHIRTNPHTLLSRFYGLHRVKLPRGKKIHFVIFNNLFPPHRDIHETFDLKGSAIGREYPEEKAKEKPSAVLKDLNWLHRGRQFELGPEKRALLEEQLRRDVAFLQSLGIMDYSLLTGLHFLHRGNKENLRGRGLSVFQPEAPQIRRRPTQKGEERSADALALRRAVQRSDPTEKVNFPERDHSGSDRLSFIFYQDEGGLRATDDNNEPLDTVYYLGIIDILTPYNWVKAGEHFWKGLSADKSMISSVPPVQYGQRFMNFLLSVMRNGDKSIRPKME